MYVILVLIDSTDCAIVNYERDFPKSQDIREVSEVALVLVFDVLLATATDS